MKNIALSVNIRVSSLALMPPIITAPEDILNDPAVLVDNASNSKAFSWSEILTLGQ